MPSVRVTPSAHSVAFEMSPAKPVFLTANDKKLDSGRHFEHDHPKGPPFSVASPLQPPSRLIAWSLRDFSSLLWAHLTPPTDSKAGVV